MNPTNPSVELLAAPHQEAIWPSKLSGLCAPVYVCLCVLVFACQDANKGMTDVPYERRPGTSSPPLRFVVSGSLFIRRLLSSSGQSSELHPPTCLTSASFIHNSQPLKFIH